MQLESTLEALRQELMQKESSEKEALSRMRAQLQEAQQQHEAAVAKKKQLRTHLMEATRALHLTRVRNEEVRNNPLLDPVLILLGRGVSLFKNPKNLCVLDFLSTAERSVLSHAVTYTC